MNFIPSYFLYKLVFRRRSTGQYLNFFRPAPSYDEILIPVLDDCDFKGFEVFRFTDSPVEYDHWCELYFNVNHKTFKEWYYEQE